LQDGLKKLKTLPEILFLFLELALDFGARCILAELSIQVKHHRELENERIFIFIFLVLCKCQKVYLKTIK